MTLRHHLHHVTHVVVDGDHRWVVLLLEMMAQRLFGSLEIKRSNIHVFLHCGIASFA